MRIPLEKTLVTVFAATTLLILISCDGGSSQKAEAESEVFDEAKSKVAQDIGNVLGDLPSPSQIPFLLQATGAEFNSDLLSDIKDAEKYQTSNDKAAMNLGIYAADVAYLASYEQVQQALKYMESCQMLSENLGIASAFDLELLSRFEENLGKRDSLISMLDEAMKSAEYRLQSDDRLNKAALILVGSFIEGLHLSTRVIETYPDDLLSEEDQNQILEPLVKIVLDQKKPLVDLIKLLEDIPNDEMITIMTQELIILRNIYDTQLSQVEEQINSKAGDYVLTKNVLTGISYDLKKIREKIKS
jgi:hypothetical protein